MAAAPAAPLALRNGEAFDAAAPERLPFADFRRRVIDACAAGHRLAALFARPDPGAFTCWAILADDAAGLLHLLAADLPARFPSLTPDCPQAHAFERELAEQYGVHPEGHPWLKPVRRPNPADTDFFRVDGPEVHEVAVGPVHAGIIEPGHFRFQCLGETVMHLEIALGYQHRGAERAFIGGPTPRTHAIAETLAGDTTIGHATAYARVVEALAGINAPARAEALRAIALELERLANHAGDLGALAGDVAFLPTASFCGRLRGDFLNITALLCGNRFGRGLVRPGGVGFDADSSRLAQLAARLDKTMRDLAGAVALLWKSPSVMARFEETGAVDPADARAIGLVGPAARACGIDRDSRRDFPAGIYQFHHVPASTWHSGDVFARAFVRWLEIERSAEFIRAQLRALPDGPIKTDLPPLAPGRAAIALAEGWRGEILHVAATGPDGRFAHYKIVDPSFHNWFGLALALRGQPISDFPLCNKSFNLSYCGHDL